MAVTALATHCSLPHFHLMGISFTRQMTAYQRARGENTGKPIIKIVAHLIDLCLSACEHRVTTLNSMHLYLVTERLVPRVETNTGLCDQILSSLPVLL